MDAFVQRVWIVGAGFLGRALANVCRAAGAEVLTIDPLAEADVQGNAYDPAVMQRALQILSPQKIFCCMATHGGTVDEYCRCYLDTVQRLLMHVPEAQIIFCSSISVYGKGGGEVLTEDSVPTAEGERAKILLATETAVLGGGGVVARLAALYGEGRCELWRRHLAGEPQLYGAAERVLNYVQVQDAADALLLLARHANDGIFNVCGASFTKAEAYTQMERISGIARAATEAPPSRRGGVVHAVSSEKLQALGWQPCPFFEP